MDNYTYEEGEQNYSKEYGAYAVCAFISFLFSLFTVTILKS